MRVARSGIDAQIAHDLAAKWAARDHALHRLHDDALRVLAIEDRAGAALLDAAGIAGVPVELAVGPLVAGEVDLLRIDDDDVVAAIHMRGEARLVLAAQAH